MTPDVALIARLVAREHRFLEALLARFAVTLRRTDTALVSLCELSHDAALSYYYAEFQYALVFRSDVLTADRAAARTLALEGYEAVQKSADKLLGAQSSEVRRELADRIQRLAGGPEALEKRAAEVATTASPKVPKRALRVEKRWEPRDALSRMLAIEQTLLATVDAAGSSPEKRALMRYLRTVPAHDHGAWRTVGMKAASEGLEGKLRRVRNALPERDPKLTLAQHQSRVVAAYGESKFRKLLQTEAGHLMGVLGEVWSWRARAWLLRERQLYRTGLQRGRALAGGGPDFRPIVVRQPLYLRGREIYDGAILLARPLASGPQQVEVFEAYLHVTLEVQARKETSLLGERTAQDVAREMLKPGGLELRTADHSMTFLVRYAPDGKPPARFIVAPELDQASPKSLEALQPRGADVRFLPTLPGHDDFLEIAILFLKSFI